MRYRLQIRAVWVDAYGGAFIPPLIIYGHEVLTRKCSMCGARHTGFAQSFPKQCPKCHRRIVAPFKAGTSEQRH